MLINRFLPIIFILSSIGYTGCTVRTTDIPAATPEPPAELSVLPVKAWSRCFHDANLDRGSTYLWELPGVPTTDPDSNITGRRGAIVGEFPSCIELDVTDLAWSETDGEYWVYIVWEDVEGWGKLHLIELHAP